MVSLPGYRVIEKIYDGSRTEVYRGRRESDQKPVVLKLLKSEYPSFTELVQFRNQYTITKNLNLPGIVPPMTLENYRNGFALVMEDIGGVALKDYTTQRQLSLVEFCNIAIQIVQTLEGLYHNRVIHKDIKPQNILINPETKQVRLIDFSISSLLPRENQEIQNPNVLEGTLAYMSPEQTGRMNRGIDYRTDFYSLGVTFYELLTGKLPFQSSDPMELVHCHIARMPTPPTEVNAAIPQMVNDIIMKLMAKTAEDRYQSAFGIRYDLEFCLQQWEANSSISPFPLGQQDISNRFVIPEKLYGREAEVATLLAAFDRVSQPRLAKEGAEMMLVAGFSGIGKTAVVNEVHKPIVRQRGYFISGKFDQFKRNIPFSALVQAFQNLMRQLLTESAASLAAWKAKILSALGENSQVIIDVIPELERIIGKQPPVPELAPSAAQNRFNLLFGKFIQVFTTKDHPLVIFLDDLQWADSASLKLIQLLMTEADIRYFLLIGAYRDNEVSLAHPLMLTLEEIRKAEATVNQITLAPLDKPNLNRLIADTLNCPLERALPLTELVLNKTKGNPFFTNQFLKSLHQDGLISFVPPGSPFSTEGVQGGAFVLGRSKGGWQCDLAKVRAIALSDDVVEFMAHQLQKLPEFTQTVLKLAACIGNQFDLETLAIVHEKSQAETAADLWRALQEGVINPISEVYKFFQDESVVSGHSSVVTRQDNKQLTVSYKFLHDRVQQAAYFLIHEDQKQTTHLKIGQLLLSNTPVEEREEKIFDIVNQLNIGVELIAHQTQRDELAQLNLMAGRKAKSSTAYAAAIRYLSVGLKVLAADSWQTQYDLTLMLYAEAAEAAYMGTDFELMEQFAKVVLQQARSLLDKVKVYEVQIQAYMAQNQPLEAVKTALLVLKMLGVEFPEKPCQEDIMLALQETQLALEEQQIDRLLDLPEMAEPNQLAAMRILSGVVAATYVAAPELFVPLTCKQVNLSVKYGNAAASCLAYGTYGLILCAVVGDIEQAYQLGQVALSLLNRINAKEFKTKTIHIVNGFVKHWKEHGRETLKPLLDAYYSGQETGDLEYAGYAIYVYFLHGYCIGRELSNFDREIAIYNHLLVQIKQKTALIYNQIYQQAVANLIGKTENHCRLMGEYYNEETRIPLHIELNDKPALYHSYLNKLILCYLFQEYPQAIKNSAEAEKYLDGSLGGMGFPLFYLYDSLAQLAVVSEAEQSARINIFEKVSANQEKMKKWAHHAPMNHLHKFYLIEAERHRVLGENIEAMDYYDKAITAAKAQEYIQEEALANELAAKFYLEWGKEKIAQVYLTDAYYAYARWGAKAKVEDLEKRYPQLLASILNQSRSLKTGDTLAQMTRGTVTSSSSGSSDVLDLATVMKASQAISGEIQLDKLLSTLMQVVLENAGASFGALILQRAGNLVIEATGVSGSAEATVLQSIPIEISDELPKSIINYVARTQETIIFNDLPHEIQNPLAHLSRRWNSEVSSELGSAEEVSSDPRAPKSKIQNLNDPYLIRQQPKSILCIPIQNQGQLIGILYLENNLTTGAFTPDRLEVLKLLSSQAAISIENALLYSEIKESESRLAQFLEAVPVGVAVLDASGKPYYSNRVAIQLLGKEIVPEAKSDQIAEVYQNYIAGTDQVYPSENLPIVRALRGESATADDIEIHQGDKIIPVEGWGTPIFDEKGNIAYAIVAFQDITDRKKAEAERIKFTQELFQLNQAFSRFVPRQFLQFLDKESIVDVQLGDHVQQEMSVLFSDIRDFTALSEKMTPEENFKFINAYLSRMEPAIVENHGFIDKYIGDAIMALFSGSADNAVKAGIAMLHRLTEYNQHRLLGGHVPIQIGIGINTGSLMLGTVGGHSRMDGTVISDAVNLASRIEELTKHYGVSLLISHHTFLRLSNPTEYAIRLIDRVQVKGKSEMVSVFEVFDAEPPEIFNGKSVTRTTFEQALLLYNQHSFTKAAQLFQDVLRINPGDKVAQIYLDRCQRLR